MRGNWRWGGSFTGDPGGCVKDGSEMGISLNMGPAGEGGSYTRDFERRIKESSRDGPSLSEEAA